MKKVANFDIDAGVTEIIDSEIALSNEHGFCTVDIKHDYEEIGSDPGDFTEEVGDFTKKYNAFRNNICGPNSQYTYRAVQSVVESTTDAAAEKKRKRIKDRADRATVEQVLDPRTKLILFRLLQRGILSNIHGCISTGKEANVYHAVNGNTSYAVKVYKTSILTFKDRDRYVSGEYRYRRGYCKRNPRKMVALWAEKEMRNLLRMHEAGLPVPKPFLLKVADLLYLQLVRHMRTLYRTCKLVHADLSEYNILAFNDRLYIIDVSQSVEHDHPHALDFLRSDCNNVNKFFRNFSIPILPTYKLFELIVDPLIRDDDIDRWLEMRTHDVLDDMLFMSAFIPLKLDHVLHFERDSQLLKAGKEANNPFQNIVSKVDIAGNGFVKEDASITKSLYQDENLKNTGDGKQDRKIVDSGKYYRDKCETPEQRKARKQVVKEEKRESRRTKIPKHVKKRAHRQHMKFVMDTSIRVVQPLKTKKLHDKVNEVRRRKEEAEKLVKERHEAVRRQHEEKIMKISEERLRQQKELKERHAKELRKQQDVLQRRMALMERDNARRREILEKNHAAASRLATSSSRKNYAFGSSTPRELSFLECRQSKSQDRSIHEKQVLSTGAVYGQRGRSRISEMSTSMYVPSENNRQSNYVSKISNHKITPVKSTSLMTQSVSVPSAKFCTTPVSHLKKKSHIQHKNCALNASIEAGSEVRSAIEPEANLKVMLRTVAVPKRPTSLSEHQIEAESRQSGSDNGNSSVKSSMSESLCIETLLNDVVSEVTRAIPHIKESNTKPSSEPVVHDNLAVRLHHAPLLSFPTAEESNEIHLNDSYTTNMSTEQHSEDLNLESAESAQWSISAAEPISKKNSVMSNESDKVLVEQSSESQVQVDRLYEDDVKPAVVECGINSYADGYTKNVKPLFAGDMTGTVATKEPDESIVKRLPSPPNEFTAHRLRREQEQRELDERKARIAAILAKSRDLSSGTPSKASQISLGGQNAQDLLKRLASNGNLPSLQKLVARHKSEPSAVDEIAP